MTNPYEILVADVYALRKEGDGLRVTKFTKDLNPVGFYHLKPTAEHYTCNCPQSNRGPCKHLDIADAFDLYPERVDKGWFYCHENGDWFPPIGESSNDSPPSLGVGEGEPSAPSPVTPEVEGSPPPPSGVMIFDSPLKRRI